MKYITVFTQRMAGEMLKRGFPIKKIEPNKKNQSVFVYKFLETEEALKAFNQIKLLNIPDSLNRKDNLLKSFCIRFIDEYMDKHDLDTVLVDEIYQDSLLGLCMYYLGMTDDWEDGDYDYMKKAEPVIKIQMNGMDFILGFKDLMV